MSKYEPSEYVEQSHAIPRFGGSNEYGSDYLTGLIIFPAAIMVVGILSVLIFMLVLCCRALCSKFKCCQVKQTTKAFWHNMIAFCIFIFFAIFIDCFQYFYGYLAFQSGLSTISGSIVELGDLFKNFTIIGNNLETAGKGVETTGKLTGICPGNMTDGFFEVMSGIGGILADAAGAANSGTKDLPGVMYDGGEYVDYANVQSGVYLTMFFAFSMANLFVLLLAGPLCKSKHLLQLMILVAGILVILLTIICCAEMILVMVLGDYCMGPADHVSELFGNDNFTLGVVEFFVKCEGSNPLQDSLSNITSQFDKLIDQRDLLNSYLTTYEFNITNVTNFPGYDPSYTRDSAHPQCNHSLDNMFDNLTDISGGIADFLAELTCTKINKAWRGVMYDGLCGDVFEGFYILWICQFLTAGILYFVMCIGAVLYLQFGHYEEGDYNKVYVEGEEEAVDEYGNAYSGDVRRTAVFQEGDYDTPVVENYHQKEPEMQSLEIAAPGKDESEEYLGGIPVD